MEPSEDTKLLPALSHMPPHIKKEIGGNLEYFDKIALRNANRDFRRDIRPPPMFADLRMLHKREKKAELKFICKELGVFKKKTYSRNELGWMVQTKYKLNDEEHESTVQGGENLGELLIEDFKSILAIPMLTFRSFHFFFRNSAELGIMPRITDLLNNLKPRLKIEKLTFGMSRQEETLGSLPFLDPDVLKRLKTGVGYTTRHWPSYGLGVLQLHRFPNLELVNLSNLTEFFPVEMWWDIPSVYIQLGRDCSSPESLAQMPRILHHFRQTTGVSFFDIQGGGNMNEALGPVGQLEGDNFHLPAEGSNLEVVGLVWHNQVILRRRYPESDNVEGDDNDSDRDSHYRYRFD